MQPAAHAHAHPLDPLSADEITAAVDVLRRAGALTGSSRIASVELREPAKDVVRGFVAGASIARTATVVHWDRADGVTHKSLVSITDATVLGTQDFPGMQANATVDEFHEAGVAILADAGVQAKLAERGVTDLSLVLADTWTFGHAVIPVDYAGRRLGWADLWTRDTVDGNPYAHLVSGLKPIIDLNTMEVLTVDDTPGAPPAPTMGEYIPALVPGLRQRDDLRPLDITQPDGVSFRLDGNELRWQGWSLRIGFNYREGLTLHTVAYDDPLTGRTRPIAYRMSLAEMVVPYRDPSPDHARRTAFDVGEWGLGFMTTSLELGCDCLGEIRYLDATLHDSAGVPYEIANAICLHEEDNAVLWKHVDERTGAQVRRMRRMVISAHMTVANYEYIVYWRLYQDGSIECEVRATGIMVTTPFGGPDSNGEPPPYGTVVDVDTYAPIHQHFIVVRLDMEVDGPANTVVASHTEALPTGPDNPHGLALVQRSTPLRTEAEGIQDLDWAHQKTWKITNPGVTNRFGAPTAYKLVPSASIPPLFNADSPVLARAEAIGHALWVTPYDADERWPCGEFVNQSESDAGLPAWTAANRSIENTDVVLWHVVGIHHVPRVEDWPVMPVDTISFWLKPFGFFDRNPSLDVSEHRSQRRPANSGADGDVAPATSAHCHPEV